MMVGARAIRYTYAELLPGLPVTKQDIGVDKGNLHQFAKRLLLPGRQIRAQVGYNPVVTGEHTIATPCLKSISTSHIGNLSLFGHVIVTAIENIHDRAAKSKTYRRRFAVETRVIKGCADDIFHGVTRSNVRNQTSNQQAGHRCIAVGKVIDVRLSRYSQAPVDQSLELTKTGRIQSRQAQGHCPEGRDKVCTDQVGQDMLKQSQHFRVCYPHVPGEEIEIADTFQVGRLSKN